MSTTRFFTTAASLLTCAQFGFAGILLDGITDNGAGDLYTLSGAGTTTPGITQGNGFSMNLSITADAADLTGTVLLSEIGGTFSGSGLYLIDGQVQFLSSSGNNSEVPVTPLPDLAGSVIGVQSSFGALTAGNEYTIATTWLGGTNTITLGVQQTGGSVGALTTDTFTPTGIGGNWNGNNTLTFGSLNNDAGGNQDAGFRGGLADFVQVPGNGSADDAPYGANVATATTGTISDLIFTNSVETITAVPEPSSMALIGLAALALVAVRRHS